jgi:hypothetical protein
MRPVWNRRSVFLLTWLTACGGRTTGTVIDTGASDAPAEAGIDASADAADASADAADAADAPDGAFGCGSQTCAPGQLCQRNQIEGGAIVLPDDAGVCPSGRENVGGTCRRLPTYFCHAIPAACGPSIDCACAGDYCLLLSSCPYMCQGTSGRELRCLCAVP